MCICCLVGSQVELTDVVQNTISPVWDNFYEVKQFTDFSPFHCYIALSSLYLFNLYAPGCPVIFCQFELVCELVSWAVVSTGFGARRGTKLRENNIRVTHQNNMKFMQQTVTKLCAPSIFYSIATTCSQMSEFVRL